MFALAALAWAIERWQLRSWPQFTSFHLTLTLYFLFSGLSLVFGSSELASGAPKLLGVGELCALAFITTDLASRPGMLARIARVIAVTTLLTAGAGVAGLLLHYAGVSTRLVGIYGELEPSWWYARVQAGTYNPNLLASFCIFASAVAANRKAALPAWLRRVTLGALLVTVLLTFSRGILGFFLAAVVRSADNPGKKRAAVVTMLSFTLLIILATVWKPTIDPSHPFDVTIEREPSSRLIGATSALATLATHPLVGSGLGTSPGIFHGRPFDAHCTPINIAATLGLPALIAFSTLGALVWRRRKHPTDLALWGGLAGLALDGLAQDIEDFRHLWVLIGLAAAVSSFYRGNPWEDAK